MMEITWHVLGPGAIGSLFACHLQKNQLSTALISRSPSEDARLITLEENGRLETHAFTVDKSDNPIHNVLVAVKAHQTETALKSIQHRINSATLFVLLQNGMGSWQTVEHLFPDNTCLLATTTEGAYRAQDHHIVHAGRGTTWVGFHKQTAQRAAYGLVEQWSDLGLNIEYDPHIQIRLWHKLAINCAINPLTVLYDCNNGDLLKIPGAIKDMQAICEEVEIVMGKELDHPLQQPLFSIAEQVATQTGNNISSMLQDYRQGKPTEIDFITGYLVRKAEQAGVPVPQNQRILESIKTISF